MDDKSFHIRIPKAWARTALVVAATALIVAPLSAVASHSFTDVPASNTFHNDIEWLKNADVTRGCNPPANTRFCPTDNVTRQQMAAFMNRLANNRVVDAATVQGLTADQVVSGFGHPSSGFVASVSTAPHKLEEIQVDVPTASHLLVIGSASIQKDDVATLLLWIQVDDTTCSAAEEKVLSVGHGYGNTAGPPNTLAGAVAHGFAPVTSGTHTISLCGIVSTAASANVFAPKLSVVSLNNATISQGLN